MEHHECCTEFLPRRQQWFHDLAKVPHAVDKLANEIIEPDRPNDTDLEMKGRPSAAWALSRAILLQHKPA